MNDDSKCPYCGKPATKTVTMKETESPGFMQEIPYTHKDENGLWCRFERVGLCEQHLAYFDSFIVEDLTPVDAPEGPDLPVGFWDNAKIKNNK